MPSRDGWPASSRPTPRQRPQLLIDWANEVADGLDADLAWQPPLWRALVDRVDADPPHSGMQRRSPGCTKAAADLPERLSLFGHTRLPSTDIELLGALSTHHDLHLWLPHPSDDLWQALDGIHEPVPRKRRHQPPAGPSSATRHPRPRPARNAARPTKRRHRRIRRRRNTTRHAAGLVAVRHLRQQGPARLASAPRRRPLRADPQLPRRGPADRRAPRGAAGHAARRPDARTARHPRDVPGHRDLRAVDHRGVRPGRRCRRYPPGAPAAGAARRPVADPDQPAVRRRRSTSRHRRQPGHRQPGARPGRGRTRPRAASGSPTTTSRRSRNGSANPASAGVSTQPQRAPFGLERFLHNTWRFGIDRILTGVAMSDDSQAWLATALPLDDVSSNTVELAGRFADFVDLLTRTTELLTGPQTLSSWLDALRNGVELLTRVDDTNDAWQFSQLQREFSKILSEAGSRANTQMRLTDVRSMLAGHLAGRPTRANFRTGTLTVCTMVPMRSVPHRVVCLVGLDDGVFPRLEAADGDDALARDRWPVNATSAPRTASCCSTRSARPPRRSSSPTPAPTRHSGHHRPAAVPLLEVLDALDATTPHPVTSASSPNIRCSRSTFAMSNVARSSPASPSPSTRPRYARRAPPPVTGRFRAHFCPGRCRIRRLATCHWTTCSLLQGPGEGVLPRTRLHTAVGDRTRSTTPCPSRSTRCRSGRSAIACSTT